MTEYNSPTLAAPVAAPVEAAPVEAAVADMPSNASRSNMAGTAMALGVAAATFAVAKQAKAVTPSITFAQIPGSGDAKVLNFALTLEALESELCIPRRFSACRRAAPAATARLPARKSPA